MLTYRMPCMLQVASVSNTPLVSQAVTSPLVARSLLADPVERDALLAPPYSRKKKAGGQGLAAASQCSYWEQCI